MTSIYALEDKNVASRQFSPASEKARTKSIRTEKRYGCETVLRTLSVHAHFA